MIFATEFDVNMLQTVGEIELPLAEDSSEDGFRSYYDCKSKTLC